MGKNNALIASMKYCRMKADQLTPEIYAAMALALHRVKGWDTEEISEVFAESQRIWQDNVNDRRTMIQQCFDETGISLMQRKERT